MTAANQSAPPWENNGNDRRIPEWMDPNRNSGRLVVLLMVPKNGKFPDNVFVIGRSLENAAGGIDDSFSVDNGSKYVIKVRSEQKVKKLLAMKQLFDGTEVEVVLHPTKNFVKCVVSCHEAIKMSTDLLLEELKPQGVTHVRRITRPGEGIDRVNTPTLILTISGTVAPASVKFGPVRCPTRPYYPSPMVCHQCLEYGHIKDRCKGVQRCRNCSNVHPISKEERCNQPSCCWHCKGPHPTATSKCKIFKAEEEIIRMKVNNPSMNHMEARKEFERAHGNQSFAAIASVQDRLKEDEKDREIKMLRQELERFKGMEKELAELKEVLIDLKEKKKNKKKNKKDRKMQIEYDSELETEEDGSKIIQKRKQTETAGSGSSPPYKKIGNTEQNYPQSDKDAFKHPSGITLEEYYDPDIDLEGAVGGLGCSRFPPRN